MAEALKVNTALQELKLVTSNRISDAVKHTPEIGSYSRLTVDGC